VRPISFSLGSSMNMMTRIIVIRCQPANTNPMMRKPARSPSSEHSPSQPWRQAQPGERGRPCWIAGQTSASDELDGIWKGHAAHLSTMQPSDLSRMPRGTGARAANMTPRELNTRAMLKMVSRCLGSWERDGSSALYGTCAVVSARYRRMLKTP